MSVFKRLSDFSIGRVILLNFSHGLKHRHFWKDGRLRALIIQWNKDVLDRVSIASAAKLSDLLSCLHIAYTKTLGDKALSHWDFPLPISSLGPLSKVVEAFSFALDDHSLLNPSKLLVNPTANRAAWLNSPNSHRLIEALNNQADAIRTETRPDGTIGPVSVRGRFPVAWCTSKSMLLQEIGDGARSAELARNALGLDWNREKHMYRLDYPVNGMKAISAKLPTFAEAYDNPFFRARRDTHADRYGRTAHLGKIAARGSELEGLPEILVEKEPMTVDFQWRYVGRVEADLPVVDQNFFDHRLIDGKSCQAACDEAIEILDDLIK
jgi:hypothetical protein